MIKEIRWIQRFNNWTKALNQLSKFMERTELNDLEKQGLIQSFEYNHELAWKTQKDFLEFQGIKEIYGARDVVRESFKLRLIKDGDIWIKMIEDRNLTVHTYNEETTQSIFDNIINYYYNEFLLLKEKLLIYKENNE